MAQAFETRHRRNGGSVRHLREDVTTLQKDLSQLTGDVGNLISAQWNGLGQRVSGGAAYVGEQVRAHPVAAIGMAAGLGFVAGIAISAMNSHSR